MIKITIECETSEEAWEHLRALFESQSVLSQGPYGMPPIPLTCDLCTQGYYDGKCDSPACPHRKE